jgi:hypothetical protein
VAAGGALVALALTPWLRPGLPDRRSPGGRRGGRCAPATLPSIAGAARDADAGALDEDGAAPGGGPA